MKNKEGRRAELTYKTRSSLSTYDGSCILVFLPRKLFMDEKRILSIATSNFMRFIM